MTRTITDSLLAWVLSTVLVLCISLPPLLANGAQEPHGVASEGISPPTYDASRINLTDLIAELDSVNPEIKAARQRWEAAKAVVPQVQALPDPRLQFGYQRMPMAEPLQGAMYGFGQEIPFPGKL